MSSSFWPEGGSASASEDSYGSLVASIDPVHPTRLLSDFHEEGQYAEAPTSTSPEPKWLNKASGRVIFRWLTRHGFREPNNAQPSSRYNVLPPGNWILRVRQVHDSSFGDWSESSKFPRRQLLSSVRAASAVRLHTTCRVSYPPWSVTLWTDPRNVPHHVNDYDLAHPPFPFFLFGERACARMADPPG
jgi:hypothetical protein